MPRALVPANKKAVPAHISLPLPLIQKARKIATTQGKSLSGYMRELLMNELKSN
jgi:hypothetical protein